MNAENMTIIKFDCVNLVLSFLLMVGGIYGAELHSQIHKLPAIVLDSEEDHTYAFSIISIFTFSATIAELIARSEWCCQILFK